MPRRLFEYHPTIGFRFVPGLRARVEHESGGYLVRVNSSGFRCDREFVPEKSADMRRALVFGDSFSAADGVSNGKRWTDILEALVPGLEVYNFALPGTGTDQQYLAYQEFAAGIEHDLLVLAVLVENIRRNVSRFRMYRNEQGEPAVYAKPYYELIDDRLVLRQVPPPRAPIPISELADEARSFIDQGGGAITLRSLANKLGLRDLAQKVTRYQPVPEYDSPKRPEWRLTRAILSQWINEHTGPVLVMPIPLYQFVEKTSDPHRYQQRFREVAAETGCFLHDPLPDLWRYSADERRSFRFENDVHPTFKGHCALAESLAPAIVRAMNGSG